MCWIYICMYCFGPSSEREIGEEHLPALISCRELTGFDYTTSIHTHTISHREREREGDETEQKSDHQRALFSPVFFFETGLPVHCHSESLIHDWEFGELQRYNRDTYRLNRKRSESGFSSFHIDTRREKNQTNQKDWTNQITNKGT